MKARKGDDIKIHLPGEWVWGRVIDQVEDGRVAVMLDNHPACADMHGYKHGDVVTVFRREETFKDTRASWWELAGIDEQLPSMTTV